jgi:hypothetical protein
MRARNQALTATCLAALASLGLPVAGLALEACGSDGASGTTGTRVTLHTQARPAKEPGATFTNGVGWTVTLTAASVSVASLDYFAGEPIFSRAGPSPQRSLGLDPLRGWLGVRSAHAHPGHYVAGDALGEMTTPATIDLFAGTTRLADGAGVSGAYQSARFAYGAGVGGAVVVTEGSASNGSTTLKFKASAAIADVLDSYGEPKLEGCTFTRVDVEADGTVTVAIDPTVWFDQVDFGDVKPTTDGSPADLAGTIAFKGFARGLKKGTGFVFSYASP